MTRSTLVLTGTLLIAAQAILLLLFTLHFQGQLWRLQRADEEIVRGVNAYIQQDSQRAPKP